LNSGGIRNPTVNADVRNKAVRVIGTNYEATHKGAIRKINMSLVQCPGCGGLFPKFDGPTHPYMEAIAGCWSAYGEVMARQYLDPDYAEYYRLSVDAYAVQHPGKPSRQSIQSVGVHLIRLYLLLEDGLEMTSANDAMKSASQIKQRFIWLEPPPSMGVITVANIANTKTNDELRGAVANWAATAWAAWSTHHQTIRVWARELPSKGQ
jgi:Family of unknown function (DUF5946)